MLDNGLGPWGFVLRVLLLPALHLGQPDQLMGKAGALPGVFQEEVEYDPA